MGWFGSLIKHGARVGSKVLGAVGGAVKKLGDFSQKAGKFMGSAAPHFQTAVAALAPLGGADGLVAGAAAHQILQHGPGLLSSAGGAASRLGDHLQGAGGALKRWAG